MKGEEVDSLDGGDVFAGYVGKVIPGVLNRDLVCDDGVFHRLQRRRPHGCERRFGGEILAESLGTLLSSISPRSLGPSLPGRSGHSGHSLRPRWPGRPGFALYPLCDVLGSSFAGKRSILVVTVLVSAPTVLMLLLLLKLLLTSLFAVPVAGGTMVDRGSERDDVACAGPPGKRRRRRRPVVAGFHELKEGARDVGAAFQLVFDCSLDITMTVFHVVLVGVGRLTRRTCHVVG